MLYTILKRVGLKMHLVLRIILVLFMCNVYSVTVFCTLQIGDIHVKVDIRISIWIGYDFIVFVYWNV